MSHDVIPVRAPAGIAPVAAIGFDDGSGRFAAVAPAQALPVAAAAPPRPAALAGQSAIAITVGPFRPAPLHPVMLTLTGEWSGTVRVLRSADADAGTPRRPLTLAGEPWGIYAANVCEPMWSEGEVGACLWLEIAPTGGSVGYRMAQ